MGKQREKNLRLRDQIETDRIKKLKTELAYA